MVSKGRDNRPCEESHPGQPCEPYLDSQGHKRCRIRIKIDRRKAEAKRRIKNIKGKDQYGLGRGW